MKRIMALVLSVFLLTSSALATEIDFSAMSVEDLRTMRSDIEAELIERGASDVGKDIKAGAYILSFDGKRLSPHVTVDLFSTEEAYAKYIASPPPKESLSRLMIDKGYDGYVSLENGMVIIIRETCRIRSAENESWRP